MFPFEDSSLPLDERIRDLVSRLTAEEKIAFLPSFHPAVERLGLPAFALGGEGAHGLVLRDGGIATVFPQPFGLGMTWDKELMRRIGSIIGDEARVYFMKRERKGLLVLFFPTIDMERDPRWGRNEEAYGEDPFLAGKLSVELIRGAQGDDSFFMKIATMPKHFYANNYELERTYINSVFDDRLKFEYYLRVFAYAFEEGKAASLMTAYNAINGVPGMLNPEMNTIVRKKWGADGFFASDGGAFGLVQSEHKTYKTPGESAAAAVKAGLDIFLDRRELVMEAAADAYKRGLLTDADLDNAMFNQFRILFRLGVYGKPENNPFENIPETALCSGENAEVAKQAARESVTLLKNDGLLPLDMTKTKKIAVIGILGGENMPDWYSGNPPYQITPVQGIRGAFSSSEVVYADGCDTAAFFSEADGSWLRVASGNTVVFDGTIETRTVFRVYDWGYGVFGFKNIETGLYLTTTEEGDLMCDAGFIWGWITRELFFLDNDKFKPEIPHGVQSDTGVAMRRGESVYHKRYSEDGVKKINQILGKITIQLLSDGIAGAVKTVQGADAAIVVLGNHSLIGARECIDRETLELPERWTALYNSIVQTNNNTVLTIIAGYPYAIEKQEAAARAVLFTAHGAQEIGTAIGETLSGANNPSGRLSMTWYKCDADLPHINDYDIVKNKMTYMYRDSPVLHEFGFGLSYTQFEYSDLSLSLDSDKNVTAEFSVRNTGGLAGAEVVQLYFTRINPGFSGPIRQLAGFDRLAFNAGEKRRIKIVVPVKELKHYDAAAGDFTLAGGEYRFSIGASSADIRLEDVIQI